MEYHRVTMVLTFTIITVFSSMLVRTTLALGHEAPYYSHTAGDYYGDDGYMDWPLGESRRKKCIDIPQNMTLCKDIGYNQMRLPNLLDHDTVREVTRQSSNWISLLRIGCHPDTKLFLCSLFAPVCLERTIWPCRTLCEATKNGCEALMLRYGYPWPEMLRCDKFPLDNDLCIGLRTPNNQAAAIEPEVDDGACKPCKQPPTYEVIADNFCSSEIVYRVKIDVHVVSEDDLKIVTARKKKKVKEGDVSKQELRNMAFYIKDGAHCDCPALNREQTYLAMGSREGDRFVLSYFTPMDKSKDMRRAWKTMRKGNMCLDGLPVLTELYGTPKKNKGDRNGREDRPPSLRPGAPIQPASDTDSPGRAEKGGRKKKPKGEKKKQRKNCKNPKKCTPTGTPSSEQGRKRERSERRRSDNKRGTRALPFLLK